MRDILLRLRRRQPQGDAGFTLVEMLTVIILLVVVVGIAFTELMQAQVTVRGNGNRLDQTQRAKTGVEAIARSLRSSIPPQQLKQAGKDSIIFASPTKVVFYANLNNENDANGASLVTYELSGTAPQIITETIQPAKKAGAAVLDTYCPIGVASCGTRSRTLISNVDTSGGSIFSYNKSVLDAADQLYPVPIDVSDLNDPLELEKISSVDIRLGVRTGAGLRAVPATSVVNRVLLTNSLDKAQSDPERGCLCPKPSASPRPPGPRPKPRSGPRPTPKAPPPGFSS